MRFAAAFPCAVSLIFLGIAAGYAEKLVAPMMGNGAHSRVPIGRQAAERQYMSNK